MKSFSRLSASCLAVQLGTMGVAPLVLLPAQAATNETYTVTVNSHLDGAIQANEGLTLREAIAFSNGTLPFSELSPTEQAQISPNTTGSQIHFSLPNDQTTIELTSLLPSITRNDLILDATSQPGYEASQKFAKPLVALTPAVDREIIRGLTIAANNVTVRGFSLYGFTKAHGKTATTPPADIFIVHQFLPENHRHKRRLDADEFSLKKQPKQPPSGIVIEQNWLGITPADQMPSQPSAFGVSVFNSTGTTIRNNRIAHHDGSAIITGDRAENLVVTDNQIIGNGLAGMPDAIRLEGQIDQGVIRDNLICGNDGSAVFMFKPEGAVYIENNTIQFNGQRLRRSAIYLMGNDHQVRNNKIRYQTGPGVTVTSYPQSDRNLITDNRFRHLEGLSIDLVTRRHTDVGDYQRGDGINPVRRSKQRHRDTGNRAINAPEFLSHEFIRFGNEVGIDGIADPGSSVALYQVLESGQTHGPLNQPLTVITADDEGRFAVTLTTLEPGDRISAIATHPDYGTSEPALNAMIRDLEGNTPTMEKTAIISPSCDTRTVSVSVQPPPIIPVSRALELPRYVHFALDQDQLSYASQTVLSPVVEVLKTHDHIRVDLVGHTDSRGYQSYNDHLAKRRAQQVRRYLLQQGVDPARITIRSLGESQLLTDERDRKEFAHNRRVELIYRDVHDLNLAVIEQDQDLQIEP